MKCFYHDDADAVGVCKACGKGVCRDCAVEVEGGLACKERCEAAVQQLQSAIERNILMSPVGPAWMRQVRRGTFQQGGFLIAAGLVFVITGLLKEEKLNFATMLGALFLVYALLVLARGRGLPRASANEREE